VRDRRSTASTDLSVFSSTGPIRYRYTTKPHLPAGETARHSGDSARSKKPKGDISQGAKWQSGAKARHPLQFTVRSVYLHHYTTHDNIDMLLDFHGAVNCHSKHKTNHTFWFIVLRHNYNFTI